jgi:hypothetical protein
MFTSCARPRRPKGNDGQYHSRYIAIPIALWAIATLALATSTRLDRPVEPSADATAPEPAAAAVIGA